MNDTAADALLANNNNKTTNAKNTQQYGRVAYGGRKTRLKVTNDANDTQERGGVAHGGFMTRQEVTADADDTQERGGAAHHGRTTCLEVTTDANNTQQCGVFAHDVHYGDVVEVSTTASLGTTRPDVFDLTGNTLDDEDSHI